MVNLRLELFNFKKGLDFENQEDILQIVESHEKACHSESEVNIIRSLNERLSIYTYDEKVRGLLENLNKDVQENELDYNLKNLFKKIEEKNQGMIFRQPLNVILDIINTEDEQAKMAKIFEQLSLYDYVREIKTFIGNLTSTPEKRQNLLSGGNAQSVYTVVESVENGHVAFISNSWFLVSEDKIEKVLLEDFVTDEQKLKALRILQDAMIHCDVTPERIDFRLDENITIGLSVEKPGNIFINEDAMNDETSIDTLFNSPIVPLIKKGFYPMVKSVYENLDKFVELDVVKHITNIGNPFVEAFAFNFGEDVFMYRVDNRQGSSLYKYESATELVNDINNEFGYDLTYFFENRLDEESKTLRKLEDRIRQITVDIETIEDEEDKVETSIKMLGESEVLTKALEILKEEKEDLKSTLLAAKKVKSELLEKISM